MKEQWRFLVTNANTAYRNMAIDLAVLKANSEGHVPPTVRFYYWQPSAITIGYFQSLKEEVDLDMCKKQGVDYVRRITGGGAVFHEHELTYSIVIPESHVEMPKNIMDSYSRICGAIMKGLKNIGIDSTYHPINDILSNGKKISGNAQTRKYNTVLQHGTVLLDVDVEKMFSLLRVANEKMIDKLVSDVKQRVSSIKHVLDREVFFDELLDDMKKGFEDEFNVELIKGELTDYELELSDKFDKERFASYDWNHKR
jgi:lipoate---protein ligase